MEDCHFHQLLERFGLCRAGYRKVRKGVKKRIGRRLQQLKCRTAEEYLAVLDADGLERQYCERMMTVSISRFFRDQRLWQVLEREVLPELIEQGKETIRVWSAGCACGQEVYSIKFIWEGLKKRFASIPELQIIATDLNPAYIQKAQAGIYTSGSLKEIPPALRPVYFDVRAGKRFAIKPVFRKNIFWDVRHLAGDPPGSGFDVIFLRNNLLTYYLSPLKDAVFQKVLNRLAPGGVLIVGSHETLPLESADLKPLTSCPYAFRKAGPASSRGLPSKYEDRSGQNDS